MYIPKPEHEFLTFINSPKEPISIKAHREGLSHAVKVNGVFGELDVYSISPNRLWYAGPEGIEDWLHTHFLLICSACPWEAFIDYECLDETNEEVCNWYYDGEDVWCNVGKEWDPECNTYNYHEIMKYEDWFNYVNNILQDEDEDEESNAPASSGNSNIDPNINSYRVELSYNKSEAKALLHIETPGGEITKSLTLRQGMFFDETNKLADEATTHAICWLLKTCSEANKASGNLPKDHINNQEDFKSFM